MLKSMNKVIWKMQQKAIREYHIYLEDEDEIVSVPHAIIQNQNQNNRIKKEGLISNIRYYFKGEKLLLLTEEDKHDNTN